MFRIIGCEMQFGMTFSFVGEREEGGGAKFMIRGLNHSGSEMDLQMAHFLVH